jgi:serine/threonine-protein kinase
VNLGGFPTTIGPYEIEGVIAPGALGPVMRGHTRERGDAVAVRILKPALASDPVYIARLEHQLEEISRLDNPRLAVPIAWASFDGNYVVASTLALGRPLSQYPSDEPIAIDAAAVIIRDLAAALATVHDAGAVHQGLNPDKAVIGPDGHAMLVGAGMVSAGAYSMLTTRIDQVMGDVNYLAPELIRGYEPSFASDIYALACLTFRCLTGQTPFGHRWLYEVALAHMERTPPGLLDVATDLPPQWGRVVDAALAEKPEDRPDAREFGDAFASTNGSGRSD